MSYFPLDRDILTSSLFATGTPEQFKVFSYLLLAANPRTGIVEDADPAVAMRCGLPLDVTIAALDWLASPDQFSRTKDHEGRRIERLAEGGIRVLNYLRRQNKDHSTPRVKRWRLRQKEAGNGVKRRSTVTGTTDTETNTNTDTNTDTNTRDPDGTEPVPSRLSRSKKLMTPETATGIEETARKLAARVPSVTAPEWITRASTIEAGNGRPASSFDDPRRRGLTEAWGEKTLARLRELLAGAKRPLPL